MIEPIAAPQVPPKINRRNVGICLFLGLVVSLPCVKLVDRLLQPPDAERIYRTGVEAMTRDDLGSVQVAAEALTGLEEAQPQRHILEGFVLMRSGRLPDAVAEFLQSREDPRTAGLANTLAGEALYRNRQFGAAIEALSTATRLDNSLTDAHRRLGAIFYDIGAAGPAERELRIVSEQAPDDPRPHRILGLMYKDIMEAYELAIPEYGEALRREPNLPERDQVLTELAECLLRERRRDEFAETIRQCPRTADTLAMEAESRFDQGDAEGAAKLVKEALSLAPDQLEALLLKGNLQISSGAEAEAVQTLKGAADKHPKDYRVHHQLSQAYAQARSAGSGARKQRKPSDSATCVPTLRTCTNRRLAIQATPKCAFQLGVAARELDRPDLAVSWFAAALALDPNHAGAREALKVDDTTPPADKP